MKYALFILSFVIVLWSCGSTETNTTERIIDNDTIAYFQLKEFFETELAEIATTPYFIYKISVIGQQEDSSVLSVSDVSKLAAAFLRPDINDKSIKKYYQESVFHDQTIKTYTISYTATKNTLELQSADIIFKEDAKTVSRIFMRKFYEKDGKSISEQLTWKPNQSFQIIRIEKNKTTQTEQTTQTLVVWNNPKSN